MRFLLALMSLLMLLAMVIAVGGVAWGLKGYHDPGPLAADRLLVIERGQGVAVIGRTLEREGVISNALLFDIAVRLTGNDKELKAGEYEFTAGMPMATVLDKLARGDVFQRKVTVREGLTSWQVIKLLNETPDLAGDALTDIPPEGALLPETYSFATGDTRAEKIAEMQVAMTKTLDELWDARDETIAVKTKEEALVLASIVEKET
ncbi:MAG TPA: endolytic transglycosylase MltG, partial [Alphaproteobacteria bacterium]